MLENGDARESGSEMTVLERLQYFESGIYNEQDFKNVRSFSDISGQLMDSYAKLVELGLPSASIAAAMMGATLNFYKAFDMTEELPNMLRSIADMLEKQRQLS
jgi:hypothetical protein